MLSELLAMVFPVRCLSCGAPGVVMCGRCEDLLVKNEPCCPRCAQPVRAGRTCSTCPRLDPAFASAVAAYRYEGTARDALMTFKLGGERRAAAWLAGRVACPAGDAITFVPSTRRSIAERGFNPAEVLARAVSRAAGIPARPLLRKVRATADSAGLSRDERRRNLAGAFVARPAPGRVILVDDIMTTGATADACARALLEAGAEQVRVTTFARTP